MKAFKIWHNQKHFIGIGSTADKIEWTTDESTALTVNSWGEAVKIFFDGMGFSLNSSKPDSLKLQ